jgi:hypothetical protein
MRISSRYIYSILQLLILVLSFLSDWYRPLGIGLIAVLLIMIVDKMGKGIVLRESTAILYVITCIILPIIGYKYYTSSNSLARLWVKYMPISEGIYFSFALPAITCFCLAITWPLGFNESADEGKPLQGIIVKMKETLLQNRVVGLVLVIIGLFIGRIVNILPGGLQFFATLFFFSSFAGLLYVYFLPRHKYKALIIFAFLVFIISNALLTGMFTIVAYMGVTIYSFFLIASNPSLIKKLLILFLAVGFILVLQNTKIAYRRYVWKSNYSGNQAGLFLQLFAENVQKGDLLMENAAFFNIYTRTNQGYNVALVMKRFPAYQPFDGGGTLFKTFMAAIIPRFLWPGKPESGGKFNMKYYAGYNLSGWSTNVGPLGEAYGSFGLTGGIIYMFFLGGFIRWAYKRVFIISKKIPLLICWIPVLFFEITYSGETDTLQILNSLFKSVFFLWLLYKLVPAILGIVRPGAKPNENNTLHSVSSPG